MEEAESIDGRSRAALLGAHVFVCCAHTCTCVNMFMYVYMCTSYVGVYVCIICFFYVNIYEDKYRN